MIRPTKLTASATVLMPFDGSPQAVGAFPVARTIARVLEGSLHLVLSGEEAEARERLSLPADQASEATFHELPGDLAAGTLRLSSCAHEAFIVMPSYGGTRPESGLGPFPEEILMQAACPVLLVQPDKAWTSWNLDRILVPQDGTTGAAEAVCPAARLAARSGAEVLILHVSCERSSATPEPGAMEFPAYVDQPQHEWPSWASAFLERVRQLCSLHPRTTLRFHWACGDPGQEILTLARRKNVDLISLSRSRSPEPGRAQVLRQVLRDAPCPILVLPPRGERS